MVERKCPGCGESRFSEDSSRPWTCDNCGTGIPVEAQVIETTTVQAVQIPSDDGPPYCLRMFRAPADGDFHLSVIEKDHRLTMKSVRICMGDGNPHHRNLHRHLLRAFNEAVRLGYGEVDGDV